jgi:ERCC4-type nuclease
MNESPIVSIRVDDRERRSNLLTILGATPKVNVVVGRLPVGDYEVDGQLIVERKTLLDLVASIKEGRLFSQLYRLLQSPLPCALLLEGSSNDLDHSGMRREAIQGALVQITLFMQIPVLRALDANESVSLLLMIARQLKNLSVRKANGPKRYRTGRTTCKEKQQLYLLQGLPGIGLTRARLLLRKFGSVEEVLTASERELQQVAGIGASTAKKIRWAVEEPISRYENPKLTIKRF